MKLSETILSKVREMAASGHTTAEIGIALNKSAKAIQNIYKRHHIKGLPQAPRKGIHNPSWNGGKTIDKSGYVLIRQLDHPFSNNAGYVREHRLVMEKYLKRFLLPTEVVHHKDGNTENNNIDNLELFTKNSDHLKIELTGKCPKWSDQGIEKMRQSLLNRGYTLHGKNYRGSVTD
jgi:hypothetical protein